MRYEVRPQNVCARMITFDLEGDVVKNVAFTGGCNGNLKAVSKLVDGMTVEQIEGYLKGNTCGIPLAQISWLRLCASVMRKAGNRTRTA